jgi:catechol 2,3-dioxygenase-like lactoylglutathione lyase family enzyme
MSTTLTPNLMSENVNESVIFYRDHLGFHFLAGVLAETDAMTDEFSPAAPLQWAMLGRDEALVMFQLRHSMAREYAPLKEVPLGASASIYIEVSDLDTLLAGLGNGVETVLPDHVTFYGMREMWIRDNNGYLLALAQKAAH